LTPDSEFFDYLGGAAVGGRVKEAPVTP
jgi:hypothetical protein